MMITIKKIVSIIICICMVFSVVPLSAIAKTEDVQTNVENDVSTEATSAFGSMLTEEIGMQKLEADAPYFISNLVFDGNKATASYYNETSCTLVVAIYDEETNQMLSSAVTSVEAESLEATVSFSSLPENFVAKVFLLDKNNASLCNPYTCNENTIVYKEFISKTVEDFDEKRVINLDKSLTNNFVVLSEETIIVTGNDETNVLESADIENDKYVFANIDKQIKNLIVGDTFYLDNGDTENITVIKIASITIEGDKAVVIADNTTLAETFEYVKINTEVNTEEMVYDGSGADDGVTYLGDVDYKTGESIAPDGSEIETQAVDVDGKSVASKKFSLIDEDNIEGDLTINITVSTKVFINKEYGEISLIVEPSVKVNVEIEKKIPLKKISLGKLKTTSPIPGVFIIIKPAFVVEFSGKLTVRGELTFALGVGWNSKNGFVNKSKKPYFKPEVKVEIKFFVGFDLKPELTVLNEHIASTSMSGVVGAEIEAIRTTDKGENHSCTACIDGNIQGKLEIKVEITIAKTTPIGGEWERALAEITVTIADFYYSETNDKFGWGECPYKNDNSGGSGEGSGEIGGDLGNTDVDSDGETETTYTIVFLDGDGRVFAVDYLNYGDAIFVPNEIPKKEYCRFKGWENVPATMPAHDVTVKPVFEKLAELVPVAGSNAVIDNKQKTIYGLQEYLNLEILCNDYLSINGDGYFVIYPVQPNYYGTGTQVELCDATTSEVIETYTIIVFGDVDGDSLVQSNDLKCVHDEAFWLTGWSVEGYDEYDPNKLMAADFDKNGLIDSTDYNVIQNSTLGVLYINQTTGKAERTSENISESSTKYSTNGENITVTNETLGIKTKIFRYDSETDSWVFTQNAEPGEKVKARVYIDTSYYTNSGTLMFFYNSDFFADDYEEGYLQNLNINPHFKDIVESGWFAKLEKPNDMVDKLVSNNYITQGFVDSHEIITLSFVTQYTNDRIISSDDYWLVEFDLTVKDNAKGEGDFFTVEELIKNSEKGVFAYTNIPVGTENGGFDSVRSMHLCDVNTTVESYPVTINPITILQADGETTELESLQILNEPLLYSQSISFGNSVDTLGFTYDKCIAGNTYTLLNVTNYGDGFELSSDNLYYINTVLADKKGFVTSSFIPKANAENSAILLIGDFGNGVESVVVDEWYNEYTITWNIDGETVTQTVIEGAIINALENPEKQGYTFFGWDKDVPATMPAEDLTFTAMFEANSYDAVFDANGGAWLDGVTEKTISVKFDEEIIAPEAPTKKGYAFSSWTPETGVMDSTDGKAFAAEWIPATDTQYTVEIYIMNTEGEYEKSSQVFSGTTDSTVSVGAEEKTGFTFNSEKSVTEGAVKADNSLVLKVYYDRNKYAFTTVTDGVSSTENYYYGATITEPASPEKQGYKFINWEGEIPEKMPAEAVTITGVFEKLYTCPDCGDEILGEAEINAHIAAEARMKATVKIKNNPGSRTIKYGEILRLTAITNNMPADAKVYWYVDGVKKGEGTTFEVSPTSGSVQVAVKLVDSRGNVLENANGDEISDSQKVSVNAGFFQKLISFFKNLFGMNRTLVQVIKTTF